MYDILRAFNLNIRAGLSSAAAAATVGVLEDAPKLDDYTEDMWSKVKVRFHPLSEINSMSTSIDL